jgi:hypothetical protein
LACGNALSRTPPSRCSETGTGSGQSLSATFFIGLVDYYTSNARQWAQVLVTLHNSAFHFLVCCGE